MRIHNLYHDENGESHFRDIEIAWVTEGPDGTWSDTMPASSITFRTTPGTYHNDWHSSPRKQYVINLDAPVAISASDGETRIIGIGEVLLLEDLHGKGHLGRAVNGQFRHSVVVAAG